MREMNDKVKFDANQNSCRDGRSADVGGERSVLCEIQ